MALIIFLIYSGLGDLFFNEGFALKLARLLCWEEKGKGVECYSSLHFLDNLEGTESKSF